MVLLEFCSLQHRVISWSYFANFFANMYDADIYTYGMPYEKRNKTLLKIYESFNVKKFIEEKFSKSYAKDLKLLANRLLSNIKSKNELRDYVVNSQRESLTGFIGGPPCPDFSVAGKNRGREGDNGKLSL